MAIDITTKSNFLHLNMNSNGKSNFIYNNEKSIPWSTLGESVKGCFSVKEILEKVPAMGMQAEKRQLSVCINGVYQLVDAWGIFRTDNDIMLGAVGKQYTVIQIADAFNFVDNLLENIEGAHYDTAGLLYGGEQFFLSASIPYSIAPDRAPDDKTECYLFFTSSHDGSLSATTKLTGLRPVCSNTISMILNSKGHGTLKVRHSAGGHERLNKAQRLISGITQNVETLKVKFDKLAGRKINEENSTRIMNRLFGKDWKDSTQKRNQVENIAQLFDYNDGNAFPEIGGSAYAMLQSITNYVDHERGVRMTDRVKGLDEQQVRTQNALFNGGEQLKQQAIEIVLQETEKAEPMPELKRVFQSVDMTPKKDKTELDSIMDMVNV